MKKILSLLCVFSLLGGCACAEPVPAVELALDVPVQADLDGDGVEETLLPRMQGVDEEVWLQLTVSAADGAFYSFDTDIKYPMAMLVLDMDGDGAAEILLSGDVYSDDYISYSLHYADAQGLTPMLFADANRDENTGGMFDYGYGAVTGLDGLQLTLTGSQDVLGTWMASRTFTLRDGQFLLEDGGLWQMLVDPEDPYLWEYSCLTLEKPLNVTLADGSVAVLQPGEKFVVTQSDKVSIVHFATQSGQTGSFPIAPDIENNWGSLIEGVNEYEWFEYVPYAD